MSIAHKVSSTNRHRKWKLFCDLVHPGPEDSILDVGYSDEEYSPSDNLLEKVCPNPQRITALGIDEPAAFRKRYPQVRAVKYGGGAFPFADRQFDVCWSNATLEHVGGREAQVAFIREIKRVCRRAFVTTPNRWFPIEVHTRTPLLHLLPKRLFDRYLAATGKRWAAGAYMNLLSLSDIRKVLSAAGIADYRVIRNRLWGFTLDFVIVL